MSNSGGVPEQAIEAAIATSSTWPIRDAEGRAKYRQRVITLLEAAAPAIRAQRDEELRERLLSDRVVDYAWERVLEEIEPEDILPELRGKLRTREVLEAAIKAASER